MISLCIQELAEITGGHLQLGMMPPLGGEMEPIGRIVTNACDVQPGDVYWAMETAEHDAASRAEVAFARGALGAVAAGRHIEPWAGKFSVVVQDASRALWQLAAWSRRRFQGQLIALTGGGERATTVKMVEAVLHERFVGTRSALDATDRLESSLSMLALDALHDFAVVEYDFACSDGFSALSHLCRPDVAVINCVAAEGMPVGDSACGSRMLEALPSDGWVVLNGDIPWMHELACCLAGRVLLIGETPQCDVVARDVRIRSGELSFVADGVPVRVPGQERHDVQSALAAFAVGRIMNISPNEIAKALSEFRQQPECGGEKQMDSVVDGQHHATAAFPKAG